jgi:hypothetical protein
MRGIGASELDNVPRLMNVATFPMLASSIHTNMSIWTSGGIVGQPLIDPINWGAFVGNAFP